MNQYEKLVVYALKLVSKKRYTIQEMEKKLQLKARLLKTTVLKSPDSTSSEFPEEGDVKTKVIERLLELKYLDDEQYAKDFIADRIKFKARGKLMINQELKRKGVDKEIIAKVLQETEIDETKIAMSLIGMRQRLWQKFDLKDQKAKAYRYLAARGIAQDAIYKALKCWYDQPV